MGHPAEKEALPMVGNDHGGSLMAAEIAEQPVVLANLLEAGYESCRRLADVVRRRRPRFVLLAARGNSDHAALYAKYLVEVSLGLPAGLAAPSTMTAYGARPELSDVLLIAVGRSGGGGDLAQTVHAARAGGAITIAVTNASDADVIAAAEHHLDIWADSEVVTPSTRTYSAQLLALWMLIDCCRGGDTSTANLLPDAAAGLVARRAEVAALAARYRHTDRLVTTGRGYSYPTAREAALKLMESANVAAHAYSGADLLHGPLAMIDQNHPVIAVVPDGVGAQAMRPVLERLADRGADVTVLGGRGSATTANAFLDVEAVGVSEELHPVLDIIPLQYLALEMALARGLDPDSPRDRLRVPRAG